MDDLCVCGHYLLAYGPHNLYIHAGVILLVGSGVVIVLLKTPVGCVLYVLRAFRTGVDGRQSCKNKTPECNFDISAMHVKMNCEGRESKHTACL